MRRPRVRLTMRRLMLAVALAAVLLSLSLAALRSGRLAADYRARAAYFAHFERLNLASDEARERDRAAALARGDHDEAARLAAFDSEFRKYTEWYSRKRRLYEHAASRPWEPLPAELRIRPFPHMEPNPRMPRPRAAAARSGNSGPALGGPAR